ncbi:MAG: hypothetical protein ACJ749_05255, partial [Flavisolibacter sp.]
MIRFILCSFLLSIFISVSAQNNEQKVFTSDVDNFWIAYDSVQASNDSLRQIQLIKNLYIDKGTEGLKAFIKERDYTPELWLQLIKKHPKFWNSVRANTFTVPSKAKEIEASLYKLQELYPHMRPARIYFAIGGINTGGTTSGNLVLIGTEIATGNSTTDVSEFPNKWLADVFHQQNTDNLVAVNIHEYVHTQQNGDSKDVLSQAIKEGSADFITELVMGSPLLNNYLQYGRQHEMELKESFKEIMFSDFYRDWLYNGGGAETVADLGYFMGYAISKAYYDRTKNKKKAIKNIIELNYSNPKTVEKFLKKSNYYSEGFNRTELIKNFDNKRPYVVRIEPFNNGDTTINASVKEMKIIFSQSMKPNRFSFSNGDRGKEYSPVEGIIGYSEDNKIFTIKLNLKADHEYELNIT